jgi:hypothetical protein
MPKHEVKLRYQKLAISRAIDILKEIYPVRILQKKLNASEEGAKTHIEFLLAALETIDGLDHGKDMRENL